jgi:tetratricopeptide (TPR) repeat protein
MKKLGFSFGILLIFSWLNAMGKPESDTIPEDLVLRSGIQVYDASKYNSIYQEGTKYNHPAIWPQGISVMSHAFQELYEKDHGERILSYPELEIFHLLQMADRRDLDPKVKNQLTGFLFEQFSGRVSSGESYQVKSIQTGDDTLDHRIVIFSAWSRKDAVTLLELLDAYLNSGKGNLAAHSLKGDLEYALENWEESAYWFSKALELSPDYSYAFMMRGANYTLLDKNEEAEADLIKSMELYPGNMEARIQLGFLYQKIEQHRKAIQCFLQALSITPSRHYILGSTAYNYEQLHLYDSALFYYEKLVHLQPGDLHAYVRMGDIYHKRGEYAVAIYVFSKALEQNPDYAMALSYRGNSYFRQKDYLRAITDFEHALDLDSTDIYSALRLADCYYREKRYQEGIPLYEAVLRMDPENYDAYHMMGYIYADLGQNRKAIKALEKSLEIKPDHVPSITNLAWSYYLDGDFEKCLEYSQKAYNLDSAEFIPKFNAALTLLRLGRVEESYQLYKKTLQDHPDADTEGAVADLNDLVEKKIRRKEARYVIKEIFNIV